MFVISIEGKEGGCFLPLKLYVFNVKLFCTNKQIQLVLKRHSQRCQRGSATEPRQPTVHLSNHTDGIIYPVFSKAEYHIQVFLSKPTGWCNWVFTPCTLANLTGTQDIMVTGQLQSYCFSTFKSEQKCFEALLRIAVVGIELSPHLSVCLSLLTTIKWS